MKKLFSLTFAYILMLQTTVYADVTGPYLPAIFQEAKEQGYVNLETKPLTLVLDGKSQVVNSFVSVGTIFVPLREAAAFFGKTTVYIPQNQTIHLLDEAPTPPPTTEARSETKRFYHSNIPIFTANGILNSKVLHPLLPYSYLCEGVTYVPLKSLTNAFHYMYTIDYETNCIQLQQPSGLVTPMKVFDAFSEEESKFARQLQILLEGKHLYQNADLQPYLKEIDLIETYTYHEPHRIIRGWLYEMDDALVLYEGDPYLYITTHTIDWQDCGGPTFATLYRLNIPKETP